MKEITAFVGAGLAAFATRAALHFLSKDLAYGAFPSGDPTGLRVVIGLVFFAVLAALGRGVFRHYATGNPATMTDDSHPGEKRQATAAEMARIFSGVTDDASRRRAMGEWLAGVPQCTVLIPFAFYLRFGFIGPIGWGLTVFFDVYCLLWAIGLYFLPRTEYHSPVQLRKDWIDRVGAFWLVGCAFGPLFGWIVTEALPITQNTWHWLFGLRAFLAAGVPLLLALPLLRYARGKSSLVALPLLMIITLLSASTAIPVIQDLWEGPGVQSEQATNHAELYLRHTERSLGSVP